MRSQPSKYLLVFLFLIAACFTFGKDRDKQNSPAGLDVADWRQIRAEYERHRHAAFPENGGVHARSFEQQWLAHFDGRGVLVQPDDASWKWRLELAGVNGKARVTTDVNRITYRWGAGLEEWYLNDVRGLEHGFTLRAPREIRLNVSGGLRPRLASEGVEFVDAAGVSRVVYSNLAAWDATGRKLPAHFELKSGQIVLSVDDRAARYPITIDPIAQQAYIKASNTGSGDTFGSAVAISGNTVVVGARGERSNATGIDGDQSDNSFGQAGAAYVFVRNGSSWTQQAYLKASNTANSRGFGGSVSISGDTIVVGDIFEASPVTGVNGDQLPQGASLAGAAYVFVRNGTTWTQEAYLKASNTGAGDNFGHSVSISGETIVVSAYREASSATGVNGDQNNNNAEGSGAAYVFIRNAGVWEQQAYLKASNTDPFDFFGESVAISGDTIVVGADNEQGGASGVNGNQSDNSVSQAGAAYVFVRNGSAWTQQAYLKASNTRQAQFGYSVAIDGNTIVVGADVEASNATGVNGDQGDASLINPGAAYVFIRTGSTWAQQAYLKAANHDIGFGFGNFFGAAVAVSGDTIAVGAYAESGSSTGIDNLPFNTNAMASGAVYLFVRQGSTWQYKAYVKASNTNSSDSFGWSLALDAGTLIVGAPGERSISTGINGNQADNSASGAGAAYAITIPQSTLTINDGTSPQTAVINTAFPNPLAVTLLDGDGNPLANVPITFTAPASGASGVFGNNSNSTIATTNGLGVATTPFTANGTVGGPYTVSASSGTASADFSLSNTATLIGTVRDRNTLAPIAGVKITGVGGVAFTDSNGQYAFSGAGFGFSSGSLLVQGQGYFAREIQYNITTVPTVLDVTLLPGGIVLQGTITDASTHALMPGAIWNLSGATDGGLFTQDGTFSVDSSRILESTISNNNFSLIVFATGYIPNFGPTFSLAGPYPIARNVEMISSSAVALTGTIRDRNTSAPLAGVSVSGLTVTDANGQYSLACGQLTGMSGNVVIRGQGYFAREIHYNVTTLPTVLDITLLPGGTVLQGTITDGATHALIPGAIWNLSGATDGGLFTQDGTFSVDSSLVFESTISNNNFSLIVFATGYIANFGPSFSMTGPYPITRNVEMTSNSTVAITGTIRDRITAAPLAGVNVNGLTVTDANGQYSLTGGQLNALSGSLLFQGQGYFAREIQYNVTSGPMVLDVTLLAGGTVLQGTIRDRTTLLPIAGAIWNVSGMIGNGLFTQDGTYSLDASRILETTASNSNFALIVFASGYLDLLSSPFSLAPPYPQTQNADMIWGGVYANATVTTAPSGLSYTVDGQSYTTEQTFNWRPGSIHTISTEAAQAAGVGARAAWQSWSDGGTISHTVAPTANTSYSASFTSQYLLTATVSPAGSGAVTANPNSPSGYYDIGTSVELTATPGAGKTFVNWSGDLGGSTTPQTVVMSVPRTVAANFASLADAAIYGTVRDRTTLAPLAGVKVYILGGAAGDVAATTDANGQYAVNASFVASPSGSITFQRAGYLVITTSYNVATPTLDASLLASMALVQGVARDSSTLQPIAGANVRIGNVSGVGGPAISASGGELVASTDSNGAFAFDPSLFRETAAAGFQTVLRADKPGYFSYTGPSTLFTSPYPVTQDVGLVASTGNVLTGTVRDRTTLAPLTGVKVYILGGAAGDVAATTDANGQYAVNASFVTNSSGSITFQRTGYLVVTTSYNVATPVVDGSLLASAPMVQGVVRDSSTVLPIAGANVRIGNVSGVSGPAISASGGELVASTDVNGAFAFDPSLFRESAANGFQTELRADKPGYFNYTGSSTLFSSPYPVTQNVSLVASTGNILTGTVRDRTTLDPLAGVKVYILGGAAGDVAATTDANGQYAVNASFVTNPSGSITFQRTGYLVVTTSYNVATPTVDASLRASAALVQGVVRDSSTSQPIAGANVRIGNVSSVSGPDISASGGELVASTDVNGAFAFDPSLFREPAVNGFQTVLRADKSGYFNYTGPSTLFAAPYPVTQDVAMLWNGTTNAVTVTTSPAGLTFSVDGTGYSTAQTFSWRPGSPHTVAVTSPQNEAAGSRYAFANWSDGGTASHIVGAPANGSTITAAFVTQYLLSVDVSPASAGSVSANPSSADGYYISGSTVQLTAAASPGKGFANWTGDLAGSVNPQTVTMSAPRSVTAVFASQNTAPFISGRFIYAANQSDNNVSGYSINPATGALTALPSSPFPGGGDPRSIAISGRFAYLANQSTNYVSAYEIDPGTGAWRDLPGSPYSAGIGPFAIAVDPAGKFAYVANINGNNISVFSINSVTGALAAVPGSPFSTGTSPSFVAIDATSKFAYVTNSNNSSVSAYTIDTITGALTPVAGSPFSAGGTPFAIAIDPTGRYAYVANNLISGTITAFSINSVSGALSAVPGSPFAAGAIPYAVFVDPTGKFVYEGGGTSGEIYGYAINPSNGALTTISGSPFAGGNLPRAFASGNGGAHLYAANANGANISAYAVDSISGALTSIAGAPFAAGSGPDSLVSIVMAGVSISGTPYVGQSLTGRYVYSDADGDAEGASSYRWLRDGVAVGGATSTSYALGAADAGHNLQFEVTPVAATGTSLGSPVVSGGVAVVNNFAPVATAVNITGTVAVGQTLTGHYIYSDAEGDLEGASSYRWLRDGGQISGATSITYTVTAADMAAQLVFEVTPVALTGISPGIQVQSGTVTATNQAPVASNIVISGTARVGMTVTGTYTYSDAEGDVEQFSNTRWLLDGNPVSAPNALSYAIIPSNLGHQLQLEIIPRAATGAIQGVAVLSAPILVENSPPQLSGTFTSTANAPNARYEALTVALPNGKVLVAGGEDGSMLATAQLFDPVTNSFGPTGNMSTPRQGAAGVLLANGKVLVLGGGNYGAPLDTAELYDPSTGMFTSTGPMVAGHYRPTATLLADGRVLVAGGYGSAGSYTAIAEVYDPATGSFSQTGSMLKRRSLERYDSGILLSNGKVLFAGGLVDTLSNGGEAVTVTSELYDPATGQFSYTGSMSVARAFHTVTKLANGKVLVAGGFGTGSLRPREVEIYDPATETFTLTGPLNTGRYAHAATPLQDGTVLITGGDRYMQVQITAELYDPATAAFTVAGVMKEGRETHPSTLLPNGSVLLFGGAYPNFSAEVYTPGKPTITGTPMLFQNLTGHYGYNDIDGDPEGATSFRWLRDGVFTGATGSTYQVLSADGNHNISFEVTPRAVTGASPGTPVRSANFFIPNSPPVATGVSISGTPAVGRLLTANYTYSDVDLDVSGATVYRWLRDGAAISGATALNYLVTLADLGHSIQVEVTPIASSGVLTGVPVASAGVTILNSAPTAIGVSISGTPTLGQTLTGAYTFGDVDGDAQGASTFRWLRNGTALPGVTSISYVLGAPFVAGDTVAFEVTPVAASGITQGLPAVSPAFTVLGATSQSIAFAVVANRRLIASPFIVNATASSSLRVDFAVTTPFVCRVTGDVITLLATGTCSITASQPGNGVYAAAAPVARAFTVTSPLASGSLSVSAAVPSGDAPQSVIVADFNNDDRSDLATGNAPEQTVSVMLQNASGGFAPAIGSPFPGGYSFMPIQAADFNRDGKLDILGPSSDINSVLVLLGDGNGGFSPAPAGPFQTGTTFAALTGDFNGDGNPDIAATIFNAVSVLMGDGNGGFTSSNGSPFPSGNGAQSIAMADFNSDGNLDLVTANSSQTTPNVTVLLGDGSGHFALSPSSTITGIGRPWRVAASDLNSDGKTDIVVGDDFDQKLYVYLGDGAAGFTPAAGSPVQSLGHPWTINITDINGDGKLDLAVGVSDNVRSLSVHLGNGDGTFRPYGGAPPSISNSRYATIGDLNGDGRVDVAMAVEFGSSGVATFLGSSAATTTTLGSSSPDPVSSAAGVQLQAQVTMPGFYFDSPSGIVTFKDGLSIIGTSPVIGGSASLLATGLSIATHSFTATYGGDTRNLPSTSNTIGRTVGAVDLTISKTHTGTFTQGDLSRIYSIVVTNAGALPSTGTVTVADTIPSGLSAVSISGNGWSCGQPAGPCTRGDALSAASSYPAISVTVNVSTTSPATVMNTATVSGGADSNSSNNVSNDLTSISVVSQAPTPAGNNVAVQPVENGGTPAPIGLTFSNVSTPGVTTAATNTSGIAPPSGFLVPDTPIYVELTTTAQFGGPITVCINYGSAPDPSQLHLFHFENGAWVDITTSINPLTNTICGTTLSLSPFAIFRPAAVSTAAFVTGFALNGPSQRNNFAGWVGMKISVGANPLTVTSVGRVCLAGNNQTHTVKFVNASTGVDVVSGFAPVNMTGCTVGQIKYVPLSSSITLAQGAGYYLVSQETLNGDKWYDTGLISTTNAAVVNNGVYLSGASWLPSGSTNSSYGPPSFEYAVAAPDATPGFLTGFTAGAVKRNDFGGWAGLKFTVGSTQMNAISVGRVCVAGNSGDHAVKFVQADGTDVPNGSAVVHMTGCTANNFVYSLLPSPVALQAGTTYFLASLETLGGDQFLESAPVTSTSAGAVNSSAYFDGVKWSGINNVNTAYVPANFKYSLPSLTTVSATVQTNPPGLQFSVDGTLYSTTQTLTWTKGSAHTIAIASPQGGAGGTRYVFNSWSDNGTLAHAVSPGSDVVYVASFTTQYQLTAQASPAGGGSVTANPAPATGYYDNGTPGQLTATANAGYTFQSWSGDLSGSTNPATVTMSGPRSVTANFQATGAGSGSLEFVTNFAPPGTAIRNNFSGWVGMRFTVGAKAMRVSAIGRVCAVSGATAHTVKFVIASSGADLPDGAASVNMNGCASGQFVYANLANPVTLAAGTAYYLASQEAVGGDRWYDFAAVGTSADATVNSAVYSTGGTTWNIVSGANSSYVPPTFKYTLPVAGTIQVSVQTNPSGRTFTVDGTTYSTAQVLQWTPGSSHTIATVSPQSSSASSQFVWTGWSDGGTASHVVAPSVNSSFTATFKTQYLLSTAVTPAGAGSITMSPPSVSGYYDDGAVVLLSGVPNGGSSFLNWSGDLSGNSSPQQIAMTQARSVSASFQLPANGTSGFVTGFALGGQQTRNDFSGWLGMRLAVGSSALSATSVGRLCVAGNLEVHAVKFVQASNGSDVPGGSASVNMAGCAPGQFVSAALPAAITLAPGNSYYLVSRESQGGDRWYDVGPISTTAHATSTNSVFSSDSVNWTLVSGSNTSYVPPTFLYLAAPDVGTPFVSAFNNSAALRNDFSGFVGMKLTVGASGVPVAFVGRMCATGNAGTHTVKFVLASTGANVAGASASVAMAGCTPGQFVYAALPASITLQASTSYYLVSQETNSGDRWYDFTAVTTRPVANVASAVYQSGASWVTIGSANMSYVPTNFK